MTDPTPFSADYKPTADAAPLEDPSLATEAAPQDPELRRRWKLELGVVLCLAVLPDIWNALSMRLWSVSRPSEGEVDLYGWNSAVPWFATLIGRSVSIVPVILYLIWRSGEGWTAFGFKRPRWFDLPAGAGLFLLHYVAWYALWTLIWLVGLDGPLETVGQDGDWTQAAAQIRGADFLIIFLGAFCNAVGEEVALYGFLFPRIRQLFGLPAAMIAVPILFTSYHIYYDPVSLTWILAFGCTHCLVYAATRRLWPLIVSHIIGDLLWLVQG